DVLQGHGRRAGDVEELLAGGSEQGAGGGAGRIGAGDVVAAAAASGVEHLAGGEGRGGGVQGVVGIDVVAQDGEVEAVGGDGDLGPVVVGDAAGALVRPWI